jgi:membrane protein YdbS with pleckstrin-like domain
VETNLVADESSTAAQPSIADAVWRSLDPRYIALQRQVGWITSAVLSAISGVGAAVLLLSLRWPWAVEMAVAGVAVICLALFTWWLQAWPPIEYRYASYRVDLNGLEIRRGVLFRTVINVPRSRVQHTDVSQGPLQRRFGLATLVVHTAGTSSAEVHLPGLTHEVALSIRDHLLPRNTEDAV